MEKEFEYGARHRTKLLYVTLTAICAAVPVIWSQSWNGVGLSLVILLGSSVLWQYIWPADNRGSADLSDPMFLAGVVLFLAFGARSLSYIRGEVGDSMDSLPFWSGLGTEFNQTYATGLAFGILCWATMLVGYRLTSRNQKHTELNATNINGASEREEFVSIMLVVLIVGWAARLYLAFFTPNRANQLDVIEGLSSTQSMANALATLAPVGLVFGLLVSFREGGIVKSRVWLPALLVIAELGYGWFLNNRTLVFSAGIMILGFVGLVRPVRIRPQLLLTLPVVLALLSISLLYRDAPQEVAGPLNRTAFVVGQAQEEGLTSLTVDGWQQLVDRYHGLDSMAAILSRPPMEVPGYGQMYLISAASPLVPRALWPGKPNYQLGEMLSVHYFNYKPPYSVPMIPTWFGDLSIQFPYQVVPVITLSIGALIRAIRVRSLQGGHQVTFWTVYAISILPLIVQTDAWIPVYHLTLRTTVVLGIFLVVNSLRRRQSPFSVAYRVRPMA